MGGCSIVVIRQHSDILEQKFSEFGNKPTHFMILLCYNQYPVKCSSLSASLQLGIQDTSEMKHRRYGGGQLGTR